jgi:hypothetical protein
MSTDINDIYPMPKHTGRDIGKAVEIIEAQALEIRELQSVVARFLRIAEIDQIIVRGHDPERK